MPVKQLNLKVPQSIYDRLDEYVERTGATKTEIAVHALSQYLNCAEDAPLRRAHGSPRNEAGHLEVKVDRLCFRN